jgi:tetratricopeptide (TPR) repeat protein
MECPRTSEWYELERGRLSREDSERLRRHLAECAPCRAHEAEIRGVAATLEGIAENTRIDLPDEVRESVLRRGRVHGLVGRPFKQPFTARILRSRWVRVGFPLAAAVAGAALIIIGLRMSGPQEVLPQGAFERLVRASATLSHAAEMRALAPVARAAITEELAQAAPSTDQLADLAMVAYVMQRPHEDRQVADVRFFLKIGQARSERRAVALARGPVWPMLAAALVAETSAGKASGAARADLLASAKRRLLEGDYDGALRALPSDASSNTLKAWCLQALGRDAEAALLLDQAQSAADNATARVLRADLALENQDVAEAMRQYESLAAERDRYWFMAGYLCRYELADARGAGQRFERVHDREMVGYVSQAFQTELAAAKESEPDILFSEDFDGYDLGQPASWALVRTRGGEFRVVAVPRGKALEQDEVNCRGAEFLTGRSDWSDYTFQMDVKVLESQGDYAIGAVAYRRADGSGYVLELSPGRLRIVEQFMPRAEAKAGAGLHSQALLLEPVQAQLRLDQPPAPNWWYTMKIRVQRVSGSVSVAGKFWRTDTEEPMDWQVVWADNGLGGVGPLAGGAAGAQISGARAQVDNIVITRNEPARD